MSQLIVQKYGGSSVADPEKIINVARRVAESAAHGHRMVVVVSAMGKDHRRPAHARVRDHFES
jgi:aspartate kinase